jgi:DNA-binding transcriptional LysR family regulator
MQPIPFSFRQIDYLIAVAETGSTAAAARLMNVSQPSVSVAISQFEDHFGAPLFLRQPGQGMQLTPLGRERIALFRHLRTEAATAFSLQDAPAQDLRLGVYSTLGPRYAPMLMRAYSGRFPGSKITLIEGDIGEMADAILKGDLDLALVYDVGLPADLGVTWLSDNRPHAILPPDHRLAASEAVDLRDLATYPLILIGLPYSRGYFLSLFHGVGVHPKIAAETGSIEMLRAMVANGQGVGILATELPHDLTYDGHRIVRRPIAGDPPPSRVVLIRAARFAPTRSMIAFTDLAKEMISAQPA